MNNRISAAQVQPQWPPLLPHLPGPGRPLVPVLPGPADGVLLSPPSPVPGAALAATSERAAWALAASLAGPAGTALEGSGGASGWIGFNHLFATLSYQGGVARLDGVLGGASVNLYSSPRGGNSTHIGGTISSRNDLVMVDVWADTTESGGRSTTYYSGFLGGQRLSLQDWGDAESGWITGTVGDRSISVTRHTEGQLVVYSGQVSDPGGGSVSFSANAVDGVTRHDILVPLLALTSPL